MEGKYIMNNNEQIKITKVGPSLLNLLVILFIALKLCGVITWSWWWVLSPIWMGLGLAAVLLTIAFVWITLEDKKK
jgi:membrane protein YdbS with pleckstrin-like domain